MKFKGDQSWSIWRNDNNYHRLMVDRAYCDWWMKGNGPSFGYLQPSNSTWWMIWSTERGSDPSWDRFSSGNCPHLRRRHSDLELFCWSALFWAVRWGCDLGCGCFSKWGGTRGTGYCTFGIHQLGVFFWIQYPVPPVNIEYQWPNSSLLHCGTDDGSCESNRVPHFEIKPVTEDSHTGGPHHTAWHLCSCFNGT